MKVWLVDKWINVPMPYRPPMMGVLVDVSHSAVLEFFKSSFQPPMTQIISELADKPELVYKWGKFLVKEGPRSTLKKIDARRDDVHAATLRACCSVSGSVETVGGSVSGLKPGDRVAGLGFLVPTHAEFMVLPEELSVVLPDDIAEDRAALILPGAMALYAVDQLLEMGGEGPVAVLGGTAWGIIAAQELHSRGEEVVLYHGGSDSGTENGPGCKLISQHGQDSLPEIIKSNSRLIFAHPEFLQDLTGNCPGKYCVAIHDGNDGPGSSSAAAGWVDILLPDPVNEKRHNLNIYSDDPLDIPPWAKREYLTGFIQRLSDGKLQPELATTNAQDYVAGGERSGLISYTQAAKSKECSLDNPAPQPQSSRQKLGVSLVGVGNFSMHKHIPILHQRPEVRFRGAVDMEPYQSYYVAKFNGFDFFSTDPGSIFSDERTECVFIVTHHDSHAPLAIDALKAGKNVFLEKPPVVSYRQLADLAQAIKTSDKYLTVGYNRRFAPATLAFSHLLENIEGPSNIFYNVRSWKVAPNSWYYWSKEGTRVCGNLCHFIDLCYFLTGRQRPVSITLTPSSAGRPDQNYVATLSFEDGSLGSIIYSDKGNNDPEGEERINFQRGSMTVIVDDWQRMWARQDGRIVARWTGKERDQGHCNQIYDTIDDLQQHRPSPYTLKDLVATSLTMLKAKESMEKKETITITEEEINSYL